MPIRSISASVSVGSLRKLAIWSLCLAVAGLLMFVLLMYIEVRLSDFVITPWNVNDSNILLRRRLLNDNYYLFSVCPMLWLTALITGIMARQYPIARLSITLVIPTLLIFSFLVYVVSVVCRLVEIDVSYGCVYRPQYLRGPFMLDRFEVLVQRMRYLDATAFAGPVSDAQIGQAQEDLGVTFPESYRRFLRELGGADFPFDIFGLGPESAANPHCSFWDVVDMTLSERTEVEPAMPLPLVPFTPNGMGDHWCMDTSRMSNGECPIVFWNHELGPDQRPKQTHDTFLDWLEASVADIEEDTESKDLDGNAA